MSGCEALFHDTCFLFAFLPVVLLGYWLVPYRRWKLLWLTVSSYAFYALWDVRFVGLLVFASLVDYYIVWAMARTSRRKPWLVASIVVNLSVLAFFKYAMFAAGSAQALFTLLGSDLRVPYFHIVLPVGISFYTFQTMSYTIDVYRGHVAPSGDLMKYMAFVSLFPQLVAGPIVRYKEMSAQLDDLPVRLSRAMAATGLSLFAIGLFKKVVIADTIASKIDPLWGDAASLTAPTAWSATVGYSLQLYFDFSGYSDMAIGLGALLGLTLPTNFNAPYQALNPSDFWRRWHISLSTFLRDYLYIPLGGNRVRRSRMLLNLFIVMGLGGLWHGAAWTFVVWGLFHGFLLVAYQASRTWWDAAPQVAQRGLLLFLVMLGWTIFRAPDFHTALLVYQALWRPFDMVVLEQFAPLLVALGLLTVATVWIRPTALMRFDTSLPRAALSAVLIAVALLVLGSQESPFLYYQF